MPKAPRWQTIPVGFANYVSMHAFQATQNPKSLLVTRKYYIIVGLKTNLSNFFLLLQYLLESK